MKSSLLKVILLSCIFILLPLSLTTASANDTYELIIPDYFTFTTTKTMNPLYAYSDGYIGVNTMSLTSGNHLHVTLGDTDPSSYLLINDDSSISSTIPFKFFSTFPEVNNGTMSGSEGTIIPPGLNVINLASNDVLDINNSIFHFYVGFDRSQIHALGTYTGSIKFTVTIDQNP